MNILDKIRTCIVINDFAIGDYTIYNTLTEEDWESINQEGAFSKEYIPKKGDQLYFVPGCTVPRFKIKDFCEKFKVSVVKTKERANVHIVSTDVKTDFFTKRGGYRFSKSDTLAYLHTFPLSDKMKELIYEIKLSTDNIVYFARLDFNRHQKFIEKSYGCGENERQCFRSEDLKDAFIKLFNSPACYNQNQILSKINNIIMDEASYKSIQRLFESSDKNNIKLAMEAMANCDFQKSAIYLLLLMNKYKQKIYESPTLSHVNFKSLLKFFNIRHISHVDPSLMLESLMELKLLNQQNLDMITPFFIDTELEESESGYFNISGYTPCKRIRKALAENILDINSDTEIDFSKEDAVFFKKMPILNP